MSNPDPESAAGVPATCENVSYDGGVHPARCLDIWLTPSIGPLVVYYHGGAFSHGDKSKIYGSADIDRFLQFGVSFATVNYRYHDQTDCGIRGSLYDCARAIQFLRHQAGAWKIDKDRIGAYGTSAGGGISLWIAFNDDMADPYNTDQVLRESTRLTVAGALSGQATYDVLRWPEILDPDILGVDIFSHEQLWQNMLQWARDLYGLAPGDDLCSCEGMAIRYDLDFLARMSSDDPPIFVRTGGPASLTDLDLTDLANPAVRKEIQNRIFHNPLHAKALWERAREVRLEARVYAPHVGLTAPCKDNLADFFLWHLLTLPNLCP